MDLEIILKLFTENPAILMGTYYIMGVLLAFTPCILPMLPITLHIIYGQKGLLSVFIYVFTVAFCYAAMGLAFGLTGYAFAAIFQNPIFLTFTALSLILLGLVQFDVFKKIPISGTVLSMGPPSQAASLGVLSVFTLSPCTTPALAGALVYAGETGNIFLSSLVLFLMGLGVGTPLLAAALFGKKVIPKSGPWMDVVKKLVGVIVIGLGIFTGVQVFL